jgi:hypothetical protein
MLNLKQYLCLLTSFTFLLLQPPATLAEDNNFEISGFARVVGGILSNDSTPINGYDDKLQFGEESLFAVQVNGQITDKISATGQLLYHSAENRDSGVEWAYLTYHHSQKLNFKLGKLRTPFFQYSDVIDVGLSYPWITPPKQVYREYIFSTFEGANVSYNFAGEDLAYYFEGYWGKFDDDLSTNGRSTATTVDNLRGVVINIVDDNLSFRVSYHRGLVEIKEDLLESFALTLGQLGFEKSAQSLNTQGDVKSIQAGITYDNLDYFARIELMRVTGDIPFVPKSTGGYVTLGYYFHPFTAHLTYATNNSNSPSPVDEIPIGFNPQLDQLAYGYKDIFNSLRDTNKDSITLGIKWDWKTNVALKMDVTLFDCELPTSTILFESTTKNVRTNLMQVGLEWVF